MMGVFRISHLGGGGEDQPEVALTVKGVDTLDGAMAKFGEGGVRWCSGRQTTGVPGLIDEATGEFRYAPFGTAGVRYHRREIPTAVNAHGLMIEHLDG